ncbi:MAG: hypothetical protein ACTSQB_03675 [Candidatus Heimdallarchaeota archaeon]
MSQKKKNSNTKKKSVPKTSTTKKQTTTGKAIAKNKSSTKKKSGDKQILAESKQTLKAITEILSQTSMALPSLVTTRGMKIEDMNGLLQDKFQTDSELIGMLEGFFKQLVLMLKYRSSYDLKLSQISKQVKKLKEVTSLREFKGNLQLLGIILNETEQIVKNYEEMYNLLFNEQALLQFQLMEQLAMFKERDVPNFSEMFNAGFEIYINLTKKITDYKE